MKIRPIALLGALGAASLFAGPASADYMGTCNKLISTWKTCVSSSGSCAGEEQAIRTQCKCHELKGDEWKLVMAAVAESNVCGNEDPPTIEIPPPQQPKPPLVRNPNHGGGGGAGGGAGDRGEGRGR